MQQSIRINVEVTFTDGHAPVTYACYFDRRNPIPLAVDQDYAAAMSEADAVDLGLPALVKGADGSLDWAAPLTRAQQLGIAKQNAQRGAALCGLFDGACRKVVEIGDPGGDGAEVDRAEDGYALSPDVKIQAVTTLQGLWSARVKAPGQSSSPTS